MKQTMQSVKWVYVALGIWILFSECARKEPVLVQVGAARLTEEGFFRLAKALPEIRLDSLNVGHIQQILDVWVDKELMILEARATGLDTTDVVAKQFAQDKLSKLLQLYKLRYVASRVQLSEEEIREYAREHGYDRKLRVRHILTHTREDAEDALAELEAGRSFEEVVRKWSVDEDTKDKDGRIEGFYRKDEVFPAVAEAAFDKKVGELFGPIWTSLGYEIGQILDEQPLSLEEMNEAVRKGRGLWNEKFHIQAQATAEELRERFGLKPIPEGIRLLVEQGAAISKAKWGTPLYEYDRGAITAGDFVNALRRAQWSGRLEDSTQVVRLAWRFIVPTTLFLEDAHRMGIHQEQVFLDWMRKREEELLVEALREREVKDKTQITEDEVREEYITHLDRYGHHPEVWIQEVLVGSEEEAQRIREQVERGEDLEELARRHSLRERARRTGGTFRFSERDKGKHGGLATAALQAQVGELIGPVRAKRGYSVFRVLDKKDRRPKSFEEARAQATATVRLRKEGERLRTLLEEIRGRYSDQVVVHEDAVRALTERLARI